MGQIFDFSELVLLQAALLDLRQTFKMSCEPDLQYLGRIDAMLGKINAMITLCENGAT